MYANWHKHKEKEGFTFSHMPFVPVGVMIMRHETQEEDRANKENIPPETPKRDGCTTLYRAECSVCGGKNPRRCFSKCSDKILDKVLEECKDRIFVPISED